MEFAELEKEEHYHVVRRSDEDDICDHSEHFTVIYSYLRASTPILFAFIIEFTLIGATVFYNMWTHVESFKKAVKAQGSLPK